jgi:hypothetical protein
MSEATLELRVKNRLLAAGCEYLKMPAGWYVGIPDRLVITPGGTVWFLELKVDVKADVRAAQKRWGRRLKTLGTNYLRSCDFDEIIDTILATTKH